MPKNADRRRHGRPEFHFTAEGWINDPHAITYHDGRYHSFFQFVPGSVEWQIGCHWGHAVGRDLFSLTALAPALAPGEGDDGVWSGSLAVDDDGSARIFYTSVRESALADGSIRTATPLDPDWVTWQKDAPIASAPGRGVTAFRDPVVVRDDDRWRMIVGMSTDAGDAGALGYERTSDGHWRETGAALTRSNRETEPIWTGSMWECPQVIRVGDEDVFIVSVWDEETLHDVVYTIGRYEGGTFHPTTWRTLSFGPAPYAASVFHDADGSPCVMFWLRGVTGEGWTGAHSIPYRLAIVGDALLLSPHPDLAGYVDASADHGFAADIVWPVAASDRLEVDRGSRAPAVFTREPEVLTVRIEEDTHRLPWRGEIRVVVDGPVLEISSAAGVFGAAIPPADEYGSLSGDGASVRYLSRAGED